eukprot:s3_g43.t1
MSAASEGDGAGATTGVGNSLTTLVPTFDPSKDNLKMYQQKVELVLAAWPKNRITELVMRLILNCQGSAFAKLQLHQTELMENDEKSVKRLIELLGGHWGRICLERQYEEAEQALYNTQQIKDESNDSYLARSDIAWSKFLSQKLSMNDLQAFVLLRGSTLSPEEKKRVVLEADNSLEGKLTVNRVSEAIRLLGASFFQEMVGQKTSTKQKVYSSVDTLVTEHGDDDELGYHAQEDFGEDDFIDCLINEGDDDATLVADFEAAAAESLQDDPELASAFSAYTEARRRLTEKFKNRGFWATSTRTSSQSSKGKFGSSKGSGKGKNAWSSQKPRRSLQDRILNSYCRNCNRKGHWKAECPYKSSSGQSQSNQTSATGAMSAPATTVTVDQPEDVLPQEFLDLPDVHPRASDDALPNLGASAVSLSGLGTKIPDMSSLSQRLRALQIPASTNPESLSHLTLEELSGEKISFGQKHQGRTHLEAWEDQEWVQFMVSRYQGSTKEAHRRFLRFVELKVEEMERSQAVIPRASRSGGGHQLQARPKVVAKSMATPSHISSLDGDEDWDVELEMYAPMTTNQQPDLLTENVTALQARMLNMENALSRVIQHIEDQAVGNKGHHEVENN